MDYLITNVTVIFMEQPQTSRRRTIGFWDNQAGPSAPLLPSRRETNPLNTKTDKTVVCVTGLLGHWLRDVVVI
jgi:hypothetical protein